MEILTVVFGSNHLELFRRAALKSLAFSKNREAISANKTCWNICTDRDKIQYLRREITNHFPDIELNCRSTEELRNYIDPIQSAVISQIERCLEKKAPLLFVPPDVIFSDGAIPNLLKAGSDPDSVVIFPHPRVLPTILSEDIEGIKAPELVSMAWRHLHQSWSDAEVGHPRQNGFVGGVKWEKLDEKVIQVTHRLPTPYLINFTGEDLMYFKSQISFGSFDHVWPQDILIKRGRQRYVTSSDQAFMVEITERDKNVPPIWKGDVNDFWRKGLQSENNKQILASFRGS